MKCLHDFFFFFNPIMKFHPFFLTGVSSSRDEISSRQKHVNSKRHFNIDGDDFVPGRVSSRNEISLVNTLLSNQKPLKGKLTMYKKLYYCQ